MNKFKLPSDELLGAYSKKVFKRIKNRPKEQVIESLIASCKQSYGSWQPCPNCDHDISRCEETHQCVPY